MAEEHATNGHAESGTKRKVSDNAEQNGEHKTAKKGETEDVKEAEKSSPNPAKIINFLLSDDGLALCRPADEANAIEDNKDLRTYSASAFNPFEELMCALILSRPIGHMLGVRSIRTLFNDPHKLCTPGAIIKAGFEGCRQAMDEARTQHRQKTAEELVGLAEAVTEHFGKDGDDMELTRLRQDAGNDAAKEREILQKNIKGLAKTGLDIFARRIQGAWPEFYPFCDDRTLKAVSTLGLGDSAEAITHTLDSHWSEVKSAADMIESVASAGKMDEATQKRYVYVQLLERAVGAELEGKLDDVLAA